MGIDFAAPAASSGIRPADLEGHLLVVEPQEFVAGIVTSMGPSDAIRATVHDIDAGETHEDVLLFPKVLVGSLKSRIGERVLARMGKGTAKPGQSAPWLLVDASGDADAVAAATAYLTGQTAASLAAPAAPAAPVEAAGLQVTPELLAALGNLAAK